MLNLFNKKSSNIKILDTSILIDGRILGLIGTGFLEGVLYIPKCVIFEMQNLADCSDRNKRQRGKRGLEILEKIVKIESVSIYEKENEEVKKEKEVDTKLILISRDLKAKLLTLDHNLNQIATSYNVSVLNINDLFNAIKPKLIVGDRMLIRVLRKGEQENQGIGNLEDGAMVIIDDAADFIGKKITVEIRSILQNTSGRLVFSKKITEEEDE